MLPPDMLPPDMLPPGMRHLGMRHLGRAAQHVAAGIDLLEAAAGQGGS
ncbi:MAG: hypothetical protein WBH99_14210 [Azovibrio sp.]